MLTLAMLSHRITRRNAHKNLRAYLLRDLQSADVNKISQKSTTRVRERRWPEAPRCRAHHVASTLPSRYATAEPEAAAGTFVAAYFPVRAKLHLHVNTASTPAYNLRAAQVVHTGLISIARANHTKCG